ncbi:hypothetical protein K439DRAFT_1340736 [Ramaria rubella]|nr:hypothetical protein K439DRAFT_1340736 [Ramaria rubella]
MSIISGGSRPNSDFDYWEFVHCAICSLPFIADPPAPPGPPSVPFWLTECGHTLCNSHLHADQSCAACGATAIQLIPLQRDMIAPMCEWFRSIPHGLDALASAAKFQQETMASLIRSYKRKCSQQRATILKTKDVIAENKALRRYVITRRSYGMNQSDPNQTLSYEPSDARNANGKRPLVDPRHHQRTSSPRSITTPLAPPRITLPPDHQQPVFPSGMSAAHPSEDPRDRPGSSRFEWVCQLNPTHICVHTSV